MLSIHKLLAVSALFVFVASGIALAEAPLKGHSIKPEHMQEMPMGDHAGMHAALATPTTPGQDAFGAIQNLCEFSTPIRRPIGQRSISKRCVSILLI
jgi:hypothetical protein